jgi:uncharacterized protein YqiB (DUF1249 family)
MYTWNTTGLSCTNSRAQNITALRSSALLTGIHRLLVTEKKRFTSPSANQCQGQLKTARSITLQVLQAARLTRRLFNDANSASVIKSTKIRAEKVYVKRFV